MKRNLSSIVALLFILVSAVYPSVTLADCASQSDIPKSQCDTLVDFYNLTNGASWVNSNNWLDDSPCTWSGVTCGNGAVMHLILGGNNLAGEVPPVGTLSALEVLSLDGNQLTGPLPDLSGLSQLRNVGFSDNQFTGSIPELNNLPNLEYLNLSSNNLSGVLPSSLTALPSLVRLFISANNITAILSEDFLALSLTAFHFDVSLTCIVSKPVTGWLEAIENTPGPVSYCWDLVPTLEGMQFVANDTLRLLAVIGNQQMQENLEMDLYYSVILPDQQTEGFIVSQDGSIGIVYGSTADTASWQPLQRNFTLTPNYDSGVMTIHSYQLIGTDPAGTYTWKVRATKPGTTELLQEAERRFYFSADGTGFENFDLGTPVESYTTNGLYGFLYMNSVKTGAEDSFGHSWYSSAFSLPSRQLANFQVGLGSTIIKPENDDFFSALCPPGTTAGDLFTGSAPYYRGAFQTIEGGLGFYGGSKFKSSTPKFLIVGTGYCYTGGFSAPGWGFESTLGGPERFEKSKRATAQLSNRLLVPPDGITFAGNTNGEFLGLAWMALPLIDARDVQFDGNPSTTPVGSNSWTLFFNTTNFKGPVVFVLPDEWADLSSTYPIIENRGFDTRPSDLEGMLMEFNTMPYFSQPINEDASVSKIPQLNFPVNYQGDSSIIVHSIKDYSKDAIFNSMQNWFDQTSGPISTEFNNIASITTDCGNSQYEFSQGEQETSFVGLEQIVEAFVLGDNCSLGLKWHENPGQFPQYFVKQDDLLTPTSKEDLGFSAAIFDQEFAIATVTSEGGYDLYDPVCWDESLAVAGPFVTILSDGSDVHYSWYRFVDQPSIRCSNLTASEKDELQRRVELIHSHWGISDTYIDGPFIGELATIDNAVIVNPPVGFEVGYVPIIRRQEEGAELLFKDGFEKGD